VATRFFRSNDIGRKRLKGQIPATIARETAKVQGEYSGAFCLQSRQFA